MMKSLFRIIDTYISNYEYDMAKKYCKIALASSIKNKNRLNEYRVLKYYSDNEIKADVKLFGVEDDFVSHATVDKQLEINGLNCDNIIKYLRWGE